MGLDLASVSLSYTIFRNGATLLALMLNPTVSEAELERRIEADL